MTDVDSFFANLPRKVVAAAALIRDAAGRVLIVKPTYRANWLLPGGTVDLNESPFRACQREVHEELGLSLRPGRLLCVDHRLAEPTRPDSLHFTFDGGVIEDGEIGRIRLPPAELASYRFVRVDEMEPLVTVNISRRVHAGLQQLTRNATVYLDDLASGQG